MAGAASSRCVHLDAGRPVARPSVYRCAAVTHRRGIRRTKLGGPGEFRSWPAPAGRDSYRRTYGRRPQPIPCRQRSGRLQRRTLRAVIATAITTTTGATTWPANTSGSTPAQPKASTHSVPDPLTPNEPHPMSIAAGIWVWSESSTAIWYPDAPACTGAHCPGGWPDPQIGCRTPVLAC